MPVEFEHPGFLLGLAAALIPLIVHLFDRRRARPLPFAAIDFVLRSQKRHARSLKIRRILLYAMRTLLFLCIPLALARPHRATAHAGPAHPVGPKATAIVLDGSLSMRYQLHGRSLFDSARDLARDALASLAPEDPVTIVICQDPLSPPGAPNFDRAAARKKLDEAEPSFGPGDGSACLAAASAALAESVVPGKRIFWASDLTANGLRLDTPAPHVHTAQGDVRPEVVLLDAARNADELPNAAITDLRIEPEPALGSRGYSFNFTVRNHANAPVKNLPASLRIDGKVVAKGIVDVPAHGATQKTLSLRFPQGGVVHGQVELVPDALPDDDVRSFTLRVPREVSALVVDGAPATQRFQDEAFFVDAALSASGSPVKVATVDGDTFAQAPLPPGIDVVLLLDVPALPAARVAELTKFVEDGHGLFIALGSHVDADAYNAQMGALLPRPLRVVKTASERGTPNAEAHAARFSQVLWSHPAFQVFAGDARDGFVGARTYRYFLLEPGRAEDVAVLASYDDGAPALVEAPRGKGRVVLDTSTVSLDWSDFAIMPAFLPSVQRLAGYLAGALDEHETADTRVGEPHPIDLARWAASLPGAASLTVKGPDGKVRAVLAAEAGQPVRVAKTDLPGIYTVTTPPAAGVDPGVLDFAVHLDPVESDLTRADTKELVAYFGEGTRTQTGAVDSKGESHTPAWTGLLVLAVAVFLAEGGLLAKA